jgi:hypothetical protein
LALLAATEAFAFLQEYCAFPNESDSSSCSSSSDNFGSGVEQALADPTALALLTAALKSPTLFCEGIKSQKDRVALERCMQDALGAALDAAWLWVSVRELVGR